MLSKTTEKPLLFDLVLFLTFDLGVQTNTKPNLSHLFCRQFCAAKRFLFMSLHTWVFVPKAV